MPILQPRLIIISSLLPCAQASLVFEPPVIAGSTAYPSDFQSFGDSHILGKIDDGDWRGSLDGGRTWSRIFEAETDIEGDAPGYHSVVQLHDGRMHNMGNVAVVTDRDGDYTSFNSSFVQVFEAQGARFSTRRVARDVVFQGLPDAVTCGNTQHRFGCPFRTDGIGHVQMPDGSLLMSVVVYWRGAHASSDARVAETATSVVAFRSTDTDGSVWDFAGTILDASQMPKSEEGPNQNDLVLLADGITVMCVMRVDSGEGPSSPYAPFVKSLSTDGGRTWSAPVSFGPEPGSGHPRLLRMTDGQIILAGNQPSPTDRDIRLSLNSAGDGETWETLSLSYWHNILVADAELRFSPALNCSPAMPRPGESSGSTSLVLTGAQSGVVLYSRRLNNSALAFSMPFTVSPRAETAELVV